MTLTEDNCHTRLGFNGLPNQRSVYLNGNHLGICKFSSRQNGNYHSVADAILRLVSQTRDTTVAGHVENPSIRSPKARPPDLPLVLWVDENIGNNSTELRTAAKLITVKLLSSTDETRDWVDEHLGKSDMNRKL
jgi:hypothetical protein